jgi:hypothetical protein
MRLLCAFSTRPNGGRCWMTRCDRRRVRDRSGAFGRVLYFVRRNRNGYRGSRGAREIPLTRVSESSFQLPRSLRLFVIPRDRHGCPGCSARLRQTWFRWTGRMQPSSGFYLRTLQPRILSTPTS